MKNVQKRNYKKKGYKKTYKKKNYKKATPTKGLASVPKSYQIINTILPRIYKFEDTYQANDIVGTGNTVVAVDKWQISSLYKYTALVSLYRQYRINYVKYRFRMNNVELTDNAIIPTMYIKYNYDPDLVSGSLNEDYFLRQSNCVVKQFQTGAGQEGTLLTYTVKPAVMMANKLYNSTNFVPTPSFNKWCDFDPAGTLAEIEHWGIQYLITNLPTGITMNLDLQMGFECRDLI